jgi:DNA polymerase (family X)
MAIFNWKRRAKDMDNEAIAERFTRLANLMEIRGDDRYRVRSYRNAAEVIETWPTPLKTIAAEEGAKGLQTLPGVGRAISSKILELLERGTFDAWEKLTVETPETTLDLLRVSGIGIKTASTLHQQFKISSIDDLKKFVAGGGLEMVDGIGEKSAERIRDSLKYL